MKIKYTDYKCLYLAVLAFLQSSLLNADSETFADLVRERTNNAVPQENAIICIGSSHMARWTTVSRDLAPLTIYNFGIGGTTMKDAAQKFAEGLAIPYKPRAIILYEGSNDIHRNVTAGMILTDFKEFCQKVHNALPKTRIYVLGIVPSPGELFEKWETIQEANRFLANQCDSDDRLIFIDTTSGLIGSDGHPRMECFLHENIHMNDTGYQVWADAVAPVIVPKEKSYEKLKLP